MLELTPRDPVHAGDYVGDLHVESRYSRWRASPTTFGPVGRVLATLAVLLTGPWTSFSVFAIYYGPIWLMVAIIFLKQIWQRQKVEPDAPATFTERVRERHLALPIRVDPVWLFACLGLSFVAVALTLSGVGLFLFFALAILVGLGALLAWLSGM